MFDVWYIWSASYAKYRCALAKTIKLIIFKIINLKYEKNSTSGMNGVNNYNYLQCEILLNMLKININFFMNNNYNYCIF